MPFKIIIITPEDFIKDEIETIVSLFENGLQFLHVRKPKTSESELKNYLKQIPRKYHKKIVLHQHYKLADEFILKGIHLTEKEKRKTHKQAIISASFHTVKDVLKSRRKYEYVFLSPIFNSVSKKNHKAIFSDDELKELCTKRKNIVALGGITDTTSLIAKKLGFTGAATLGYIWESKNPIRGLLKIKQSVL